MNTTTTTRTVDPSVVNSFRNELHGTLVQPGDADYDEQRKIYNGMINKRPAYIARCVDAEDVIAAVNFGQTNHLRTSIRGGGHNGAGLSLIDNGLVIDLSPMKHIEIDEKNQTATVQAGCVLGDVDKAGHPHGLTLPGGIISTTGVGGLTLGGGLGYLTRKYGLTIDHVLGADVVLADGSMVRASADENSDLYWAIRGGGGNFGIVTTFTFKMRPVKNVYAGPMFWPLDQAEAAMKFYRQHMTTADNDLYGFFAFLIVPPADPFPSELHGKNVCGVVWNYTGPIEKAEEVFKPIRAFGPPILDFVGEIPMPALNSMFDALYPPGMQWYWRADFFDELTDDAIKDFIVHGSKIPTGHSTMHLYQIDGKAAEVANDATPWNNRHSKWAEVIVGVDPDPANKDVITKWCKDYWQTMHPHSTGSAYVNFMMEEGQERVKATYGSNYKRLQQIKAKYDPGNFFNVNQNIKPA